MLQFVCTARWVVSCVQSAIFYTFKASIQQKMLVTMAMLKDIYSVKETWIPFRIMERRACTLWMQRSTGDIVISTTQCLLSLVCFCGSFIVLSVPLETVPVLLSCGHHSSRQVPTVNVSHLNKGYRLGVRYLKETEHH